MLLLLLAVGELRELRVVAPWRDLEERASLATEMVASTDVRKTSATPARMQASQCNIVHGCGL